MAVDKVMRELIEEATLDDIPMKAKYRPIAEITGIEAFIYLSEYANGDDLYIPKPDSILIPARDRRIKKEFNGGNAEALAKKYNLTPRRVAGILKNKGPAGSLLGEVLPDDVPAQYRPIVEITGLEAFVALTAYVRGASLYLPKADSILIPARNRRIRKEWDGYNARDLAEKYNLTAKHIGTILKGEPLAGQMSLFDMEGFS